MRILYLSCHSILEFDEISLFNQLGHYVFSPGAYVEPRNPGDPTMRPGLNDIQYDQADIDAWNSFQQPGVDGKTILTKEFVDRFDAVIVMHLPQWIYGNWKNIQHKPVVWRTIGQSIWAREQELEPFRARGLKIVRYSPRERTIPGYIGEDAIIRFYKDQDEFTGWNGNEQFVCTFQQDFPNRKSACNYAMWELATSPFPRKLFGPNNNGIPGWRGKASYAELKAELANNRAYFYVGTHPASYTLNFMESLMTGIPIVSIGSKLGNGRDFPGHDLFEVADFIKHGENGFISDDAGELRDAIRMLMNDSGLAQKISQAGRATAIELFGKDKIAKQWQEFLSTLI